MAVWKKILTAADITALGSGSIITGAERTKLNGIETAATADQTGAEIKAAYEAETSAFTDAQFTKLGGIEALADVTDAANVASAGALMDSEVDEDIKTLALPANTTISTFGASLIDDADAGTARGTLGLGTAAITASSAYATSAQGTLAANALPLSGGAMTGAITTNSTFDGVDIAARDAVLTTTTTTANAALPKAGGTMSGAIAMGTLKVTGLGDPSADQDAATKAYVDTAVGDATDNNVNNANLLAKLAALESTSGAGTAEAIVIGASDDDTIVITGNLQVSGSTTTVNTAELTVEDHIITAAFGSANAAAAGTAGLEIATGDTTQLPFVGFVNGAGLTEMVVKAEGNATARPIAIMDFVLNSATAPASGAASAGVGSFFFAQANNTSDGDLYLRVQ